MTNRVPRQRKTTPRRRTPIRAALTLLALILAPVGIPAQQTLDDADWFVRDVGAGVVWRYYLFDSLFGSRQSVSYIDIDLNDPSVSVQLPYLVASRQKTSSMIQSQFPDAVGGMNGTYFDTAGTGGHRTYLRVDGTEIPPGGDLFAPWGYEGALALDAFSDASIEVIPSEGWAHDATHPDIIACGPLLMVGGIVPSAYLTSIGSHCTSRHPRSAVGMTADSHLILLTVDGRTDMASGMTCEEVARVLEQLGCVDALNMDGGGSTTLWGNGELYNGVLNYPSDNGFYDHSGERACSNAIAIESAAPTPKTWDGRLRSKVFNGLMDSGSRQTGVLAYDNIGTATWTVADTKLVLARPDTRVSDFHDASGWPSPSQPALMNPETVAPNETATFTFVLKAPEVLAAAVYNEHFMLVQSGMGRIGPADSEAWMKIIVQPPVAPGTTFIVESRAGGQNYGWYSDSGMADSGANCTAPGCTGNIGTRYGSTYRSVAGYKSAVVAPDFPDAGYYKVYVAWGSGSSRRNPVTYRVHHSGGTDTFHLDQSSTANAWVQLGTVAFHFDKGHSGQVIMTNEDIDVSGSMYAGAVKFEPQESAEEPEKSYGVKHLGSLDGRPVINGVVDVGEWDAATSAGTGYVAHDNPTLAAVEDGSFRMLFDDSYLYILFRMSNSYLAGYPTPPVPYGYHHLLGDKVNFFFTPFGVSGQSFYRILFSPNPSDGNCYVWSQASVVKTTDAFVGTDWVAEGDVAYTYTDGILTIEYRIPWIGFDYAGINLAERPAHGAVWGVQPCITNEVSLGNWEYVNWEPDDTPAYVFGEPFGALRFEKNPPGVCGWSMY